MKLFLASAVLLSVPSQTLGHITSVCTVTHPQRPGEISFMLGTYHGIPNTTPGVVIIKDPAGTESSFSFTDACNFAYYNDADDLTVDDVKSRGQTQGCFCDNAFGCGSYNATTEKCTACDDDFDPSLLHVECYGELDVGGVSDWAITKEKSDKNNCAFDSDDLETFYFAKLDNAITGIYEVWTSGVDFNLDAYSYEEHPCNMAYDAHVKFGVSVADGGAECTEAPSVSGTSRDCYGNETRVISGQLCATACPEGQVPIEAFKCTNGVWDDEAYCVDPDASCSANDVQAFDPNIAGISGDGCGFSVPVGTNCTVSCPEGMTGGGVATCSSANNNSWALNAGYQPCTPCTYDYAFLGGDEYGKCDDHWKYDEIDSVEDCEAAAEAVVGVPLTAELRDNERHVNGCYVTKRGQLRYNSRGSSSEVALQHEYLVCRSKLCTEEITTAAPTTTTCNRYYGKLDASSCEEADGDTWCTIDTADECEIAADELDHKWQKAQVRNNTDQVAGCYTAPSSDRERLRFNENIGSTAGAGDNNVVCRTCECNSPPPTTTFGPCLNPVYSTQKAPTCEDAPGNWCTIDNVDQCEAAADDLDLPWKSAQERNNDVVVYGCYQAPASLRSRLRFNKAVTSPAIRGQETLVCRSCC